MKPRRQIVLLLVLLLDVLLGDPPNRLHPVAWMGSLIARMRTFRPVGAAWQEFGFGTALVLVGGGITAVCGRALLWLLSLFPLPLAVVAEAILLKSTLSLRGLWRAAGEVQQALAQDDLPAARRLLAWHLVSRDTSVLTPPQVTAAAIESVAENSSDGVVAPLCFYAVGGLPAALVYRFVNTADAMLGYRDPEREWLGKFPARLDDVCNFIPARLTGWLTVAAAQINGRSGRRARQVMARDAQTTASPNAGYPMSSMAGALGVELEKVGHYRLGAGLRPPQVVDLARARRIMVWVCTLAVLVLLPMVRK